MAAGADGGVEHDGVRGETILLTGGNRGVGREAAQGLAALGARVLLVARNAEAGEAAVREIRGATGNDRVELLVADLASLSSVRELAAEVGRRTSSLDMLIHNAAVVPRSREVTVDGFELQFAVNHLAPFLLTALLRPLLERSRPSRVITVASTAHFRARMRWDDLQHERRYSRWGAYAQSKLANVLFTMELARRGKASGLNAICLHPGVYGTGLLQNLAGPLGALVGRVMPGPEAGGRALVHLASAPAPRAATGVYFHRTRPSFISPVARDEGGQRRLWAESEALVRPFLPEG